jgi:hypothetical protein
VRHHAAIGEREFDRVTLPDMNDRAGDVAVERPAGDHQAGFDTDRNLLGSHVNPFHVAGRKRGQSGFKGVKGLASYLSWREPGCRGRGKKRAGLTAWQSLPD